MTTKTPKKNKEKIDYTKSVSISKDIWFYPNPKSFDFVVWVNNRYSQFRISHKKLKKFMK